MNHILLIFVGYMTPEDFLEDNAEFNYDDNWEKKLIFKRNEVIIMLEKYGEIIKNEMIFDFETEITRKANHCCTMGFPECNARGCCDGSC